MPLIEDFNLDDIFSEAQRDQILNTKRQKLAHSDAMSISTDDEERINPRAPGFMPESQKLSSMEKELLCQQLSERCVQSNCNRQNLMILKSTNVEQSDLVSTRLANLKEMCNFMLINHLTTANAQISSQQSSTEDQFFN